MAYELLPEIAEIKYLSTSGMELAFVVDCHSAWQLIPQAPFK